MLVRIEKAIFRSKMLLKNVLVSVRRLFNACLSRSADGSSGTETEADGELINNVLRLSIYCVRCWNSMEKSWHHFQPIPGRR